MNSIFNKNTNTFFGRNGYLLLASAWLFTISFIIDNYWSGTSTINAVQRRIQRNINKNQRKSDDFFNNTALINKVINRSYSEKEINDFVNKDYFIFIYKITPFAEPQPVFWNTQVILPDSTVLDKPDGRYFKRLVNGWYVINKKSYENSNGLLYEIVSLIPVKWNYYIVNKYLINSFIAVDNIQEAYDVSIAPTNIAIKDINGNKLFYLKQIKYNIITRDNIISILLRILAGILVLFFIQKFARFYYERKGFWPAFSVLIISIIILRTLSYFLPIPLNFKQLELFSSDVYGSNFIFHSLGDLLINSLLFIWVVL
ncbi:MAG TPA: hypothetical protein VLM16_09715, partial [Ginsengibacter sp.]|nr:hypothetical protein [Ginsengibacter sp.]